MQPPSPVAARAVAAAADARPSLFPSRAHGSQKKSTHHPKKTHHPKHQIQDIVTRYASATGHHVSRRFGWDCHGLPVEYEIDKKLGIKSRDDVLAMGIAAYNEECRAIVMRYSSEWERTVRRLGRWIDFKNDYKTLDKTYMESVWWVFKQLHEKGLVYRGFKVMPFSTACSTPLSNFEAGLNYKDVQDPAVTVSFPIVGDGQGASLVAWTTTPWTLPSNLALCVHPELEYVRARDPATGKVYVVAEARLCQLPGAVVAPEKEGGKKKSGGKKAAVGGDEAADKPAAPAGFEILARFPGKDLDGLRYEPLFPYFRAHAEDAENHPRAFTVVTDGYVTSDSGTGVVHQAPAFGEDDYRVCLAHGVVAKGEGIPCPVDMNGRFTGQVPEFAGK
jgi:isoleucyl-tRNA synthetase